MITAQIDYQYRKPSQLLCNSLLGFAVEGKMDTKVCKSCGTEKSLEDFSRHQTCKGGYNTICKSCVNLKSRKWYDSNKERDSESGKLWYAANKESRAATQKIWNNANKEKNNERSILWNHENKERKLYLSKQHYLNNKDRKTETTKLYELNNKDKISARKKQWRKNNKEEISARCKKYYTKNKEKIALNCRLWRKENPDIANAAWFRKHTAKLKAIPSWANHFFIGEIYHLARIRTEITGIKWQVDHIIPLQSEKVCGLHCEANLQVITASENSSKSNRCWPDMP